MLGTRDRAIKLLRQRSPQLSYAVIARLLLVSRQRVREICLLEGLEQYRESVATKQRKLQSLNRENLRQLTAAGTTESDLLELAAAAQSDEAVPRAQSEAVTLS